METKKRHKSIFKFMHFIIAFIAITCFCFIWIIPESSSPFDKSNLFYIKSHVSLGFLFLLLLLPRYISSKYGYEKIPGDTLKEKFAITIHKLLYLFMFLTPVSGYIMLSSKGFFINWFGLINIPNFIGKNENFFLFKNLHEIFSTIFLILIFIHIFGAIYNQFILKNKSINKVL